MKAPPRKPPSKAAPKPKGKLSFSKPSLEGLGIGIYGKAGIGKTSLAAMAPGPIAFFDLDRSLGALGLKDVQVVDGIECWAHLRDALQADGWDDIQTIVIDSLTAAEEWATEYTIENVPHEKGHAVTSVEGYGFGKGYRHVYDTFCTLLGDLEGHRRAGRHVVLVCHEIPDKVPHAEGEDYLAYQPRLYAGKYSIRDRYIQWLDELYFVGYDVVSEKGKGTGSGTRTIYPNTMPHCVAKSRRGIDWPFQYAQGSDELWQKLFKEND